MGLLDDAIREHLDLKRRRGADPTEVEREEREVLGPVRAHAEGESGEFVHDDEFEGPDSWSDEEPADEGETLTALDYPEPVEPYAAGGGEPYAAGGGEPYAAGGREPYRAADAGHEPEPYLTSGRDLHGTGETVEYDVDEALANEAHIAGEREREDVLEETPDFLQDTPDHDRLWFEQRPPRDFDFDG